MSHNDEIEAEIARQREAHIETIRECAELMSIADLRALSRRARMKAFGPPDSGDPPTYLDAWRDIAEGVRPSSRTACRTPPSYAAAGRGEGT